MNEMYYVIKRKRSDGLRLLVYTHGVPHYYFLTFYSDSNGDLTKIIRERDGKEFYHAITECINGKTYFNSIIVQSIDTCPIKIYRNVLMDSTDLKKVLQSKYTYDLKLPLIIGWAKIEKPPANNKGLILLKYLKKN